MPFFFLEGCTPRGNRSFFLEPNLITALCSSCGVPIYWLKYAKTGKVAPIDIEEGFGGNITIDLQLEEYTIVPKGSRPASNRHRSHFSTCPAAGRFRRK